MRVLWLVPTPPLLGVVVVTVGEEFFSCFFCVDDGEGMVSLFARGETEAMGSSFPLPFPGDIPPGPPPVPVGNELEDNCFHVNGTNDAEPDASEERDGARVSVNGGGVPVSISVSENRRVKEAAGRKEDPTLILLLLVVVVVVGEAVVVVVLPFVCPPPPLVV